MAIVWDVALAWGILVAALVALVFYVGEVIRHVWRIRRFKNRMWR